MVAGEITGATAIPYLRFLRHRLWVGEITHGTKWSADALEISPASTMVAGEITGATAIPYLRFLRHRLWVGEITHGTKWSADAPEISPASTMVAGVTHETK